MGGGWEGINSGWEGFGGQDMGRDQGLSTVSLVFFTGSARLPH